MSYHALIVPDMNDPHRFDVIVTITGKTATFFPTRTSLLQQHDRQHRAGPSMAT
jgi:hypothetical protein